MVKYLANLWLKLRVSWSNYRNRDNIVNIAVDEKINIAYSLASLGHAWYSNFEYTSDGIRDLFDSMRFPAECYYKIKTSIFKDDCDGFHAALYHVATQNKLDAYLLTYVNTTLIKSHTVVLIKQLNKYWVVDYTTMISDDTLSGVIDKVLKRRNVELLTYNLVKFNYNKGKYETVEEEI